ncbi:MAG: hypothetical protein HY912_16045 [Desulfomonile tiedjei]|uniref:Uncharacterized protein n=1 Tax=Desulfomonile tiedjei TaxID=2358 RepID=A0A9D6V2Q5_9BACT|nr:hypothetical protein [Desulfomonile tiedjei]
MSVEKRKTGFFLLIRPFGGKLIGVKTAARTKSRAKEIEMAILMACRSADYRGLDYECREACVRMFRNQGWEIPGDLRPEELVRDELTLWRATEIFLSRFSLIISVYSGSVLSSTITIYPDCSRKIVTEQ